MTLGRLHVVVDLAPGRGGDGLALTDAVLAAGAPVVQVRVKGMTDAERLGVTAAVAERCRAAGATSIVNDRADVAVAVDAGGVHVGAEDLPVAAVRAVVGPDRLVGGTARDPVTARRLEAEGADYLGVGPAYATTSKTGLPDPLGPDRVGEVAAAVGIPVIAIAGVTAARVPELRAAGAHGVAVISAVAGATDPGRAVTGLLAALSGGNSERKPTAIASSPESVRYCLG